MSPSAQCFQNVLNGFGAYLRHYGYNEMPQKEMRHFAVWYYAKRLGWPVVFSRKRSESMQSIAFSSALNSSNARNSIDLTLVDVLVGLLAAENIDSASINFGELNLIISDYSGISPEISGLPVSSKPPQPPQSFVKPQPPPVPVHYKNEWRNFDEPDSEPDIEIPISNISELTLRCPNCGNKFVAEGPPGEYIIDCPDPACDTQLRVVMR